MSYSMLHHDNRSRHAVGQLEGIYLSPAISSSGSEDGPTMDVHGNLEESFEMKDLIGSHPNSRYLGSAFDPEFEDSYSDEEEKSLGFPRSRRSSASTLQSSMLYTPDEERSVIRKFDRRLVLFLALLYMLSFLDRSSKIFWSYRLFRAHQRSDIGNARIAGLAEDLHLSSLQYEWLLRAFYITYILFEWMTLLWKVFPPHVYRTYARFLCHCSITLFRLG